MDSYVDCGGISGKCPRQAGKRGRVEETANDIMGQAMEMILTSALVDGDELHRLGVISQTMPKEDVLAGAMACARKIASQSAPLVALAKQAILIGKQTALHIQRHIHTLSHMYNCPHIILIIFIYFPLFFHPPFTFPVTFTNASTAEQADLDTGLKLERALYYSSFSLRDRTEGMSAFLEKRKPVFEHC